MSFPGASLCCACADEALPLGILSPRLGPTGLAWAATQNSISPLREAVTVAIGDIIMCSPGEGRLDLATGQLTVDNSSLVDLLGGPLEDFQELAAQGCSGVQHRSGRPQPLVRIDRAFMDAPTQTLVGGRCLVLYCVGVVDRALPSGHAQLECRFLPGRAGRRFKVPRRRALRHPVSAEGLARAAGAIH